MNWQEMIGELRTIPMTYQAIADYIGMSDGNVHDLLTGRKQTMKADKFDKLCELHKSKSRAIKRARGKV